MVSVIIKMMVGGQPVRQLSKLLIPSMLPEDGRFRVQEKRESRENNGH
jgi:hypothetical protein